MRWSPDAFHRLRGADKFSTLWLTSLTTVGAFFLTRWALRSGMTVLNSPGTIDSDYRGEVQVILANLGGAAIEIRRGDRIAQLVVQPVVQAQLIEVEAVAATSRGAGGFGSTGAEATTHARDKKKKEKTTATARSAPDAERKPFKPRT